MDSATLAWLLVACVFLLFIIGALIRDRYIMKKESMRGIKTIGNVTGKEVIEQMLKEANIEGVKIEPRDATLQAYYYSVRRNSLVISTHSCYNCGYYEVMRAATTAANAVQRQEGYGTIDLYLWLAPAMEWLSRLLPFIFVIYLYVVFLNPVLISVAMLCIWLVVIFFSLLMLDVRRDASRRSCEWLIAHGYVAEENRERLEKVGRYVARYNLMIVLFGVFASVFARRKFMFSDVNV